MRSSSLAPWSVREMYNETIRAFNLAERFRVPVILLSDEGVGHLRERVEVPAETEVYDRLKQPGAAPFGDAVVPPMPSFGEGEKLLVTGSTHDAWGYRRTSEARGSGRPWLSAWCDKIGDHRDEIDPHRELPGLGRGRTGYPLDRLWLYGAQRLSRSADAAR